ncbi:zinc metallopeptidase [Erysipelothrix sp. HDW6C]|nr:zinc metallopeptidase [Erysipelothrix sp. HDW6C]
MGFFNFAGMGFVIIAAIISFGAQMFVQSSYSKYRKVRTMGSMTGAEIAQKILDLNNITDVQVIQSSGGQLSDHYDPTKKVVALSPEVYQNNSIASVAVAAHEVGHAIQHAQGYAFIALRNRILPLAIVGNNVGMIAVMIGLFANPTIFWIGIAALSLMALFQLVTLPVEFDASARALRILNDNNLVEPSEVSGARSMLTAAALTYVAALLSTILNLMRYIAVFNSGRSNRN